MKNLMKAAILFAEADKSNLKNFAKDATAIYAVANNRLNNTDRWGYNNMEEVITDEGQFTGYGSPEFQKVVEGNLTDEEEKYFKKALQIIKGYDSGLINDPTDGADHYYNPELADPSWGRLDDQKKVKVGEMFYPETYHSGSHRFLRETLRQRKSRKRSE